MSRSDISDFLSSVHKYLRSSSPNVKNILVKLIVVERVTSHHPLHRIRDVVGKSLKSLEPFTGSPSHNLTYNEPGEVS